MSELKTVVNDNQPYDFIMSVENQRRKEDALVLLTLFERVTGVKAKMWGTSIVGYGDYTYTLANGKTDKFMRSGFSPRKQNLTLYVMAGFSERMDLVDKLGKVKTSKACLYINKLADVDMQILEQLIRADLEIMNSRYPD